MKKYFEFIIEKKTPDIDKKSDEYTKARTLLGAAKSVKADKANRISYFTRRFQRATKAEMETAAKKYIGAITGRLAKAEGHALSKMKKLEKTAKEPTRWIEILG